MEIALKCNQFEIVCFLIKQKIDKNSINVEHENVLHLACKKFKYYHLYDIMQQLLNENIPINILAKDLKGNLPIHYVFRRPERLHYFLSFNYTYIGIHIKNGHGYTCIWLMNKKRENFCLTTYKLLLFGIN